MSEHKQNDKKKSRDIFSMLGDATYEGTKSYYSYWWDMWNYKYGLTGAVIAVIYFYGPDIFTQGYSAIIIFGIILTYTLLHYYVYEVEVDEESTMHKIMTTINNIGIFIVVCTMLYLAIVILFYMFKDAGVII